MLIFIFISYHGIIVSSYVLHTGIYTHHFIVSIPPPSLYIFLDFVVVIAFGIINPRHACAGGLQ